MVILFDAVKGWNDLISKAEFFLKSDRVDLNGIKISNPAVDFTHRAERGEFNNLNDEEYECILTEVKKMSSGLFSDGDVILPEMGLTSIFARILSGIDDKSMTDILKNMKDYIKAEVMQPVGRKASEFELDPSIIEKTVDFCIELYLEYVFAYSKSTTITSRGESFPLSRITDSRFFKAALHGEQDVCSLMEFEFFDSLVMPLDKRGIDLTDDMADDEDDAIDDGQILRDTKSFMIDPRCNEDKVHMAERVGISLVNRFIERSVDRYFRYYKVCTESRPVYAMYRGFAFVSLLRRMLVSELSVVYFDNIISILKSAAFDWNRYCYSSEYECRKVLDSKPHIMNMSSDYFAGFMLYLHEEVMYWNTITASTIGFPSAFTPN